MPAFSLTVGDVIETTVIYVKMGQLIENKIDYLIGGTPAAASSTDLLVALGTRWLGYVTPLQANNAVFTQARAQQITDILLASGRPKRVRGKLAKATAITTGNTFVDGSATTPHLPVDVTISVTMVTNGQPRKYWGRKSHGPLAEAITGSDGEILSVSTLDPIFTSMYVPPLALGATTMTAQAVIVPAAVVAAQALPHAALSTYVMPVVAVETGPYVGSQKTRRVSPNDLLGH